MIDVRKVARLAQLKVTEEEANLYQQQMLSLLEYFNQLAALPTKDIEPLVTPTDMEALWREDQVKSWDQQEKAMDQAPEKMGNLFKVPPVV